MLFASALCNPSQLCVGDMLDLLEEDYSVYMSDSSIYDTVHSFLLESDICHKSFLELKKLFDNAINLHQDSKQILIQIKTIIYTNNY